MKRVVELFGPVIINACLLLLGASPAHAGVIQIDFSASVINGGGPLGAQGDEFNGLIRIDLIDFPDRDPSPSFATFGDGPLFGTALEFTDAITFDLFPVGGTPNFDREDSVVLAIGNSPDGDRLNVFVRGKNSPGDIFDELSFEVDGTSDLFAGDFGLEQNLPALEALLLSFNFDQAIPRDMLASTVISNVGPGSPNSSNIGSGSPNEETVLRITRASVTLLPGGTTDVPEPGHLGMLALCLLLLRKRESFKWSAQAIV